MATWRCPFCGNPQTEAARCWVCHRSTTACATCRHFRQAVAVQLGYCGLDRRRTPLTGREQRGCWASRAGETSAGNGQPSGADYGLWAPPGRGRAAGE